MKDFLKLKMFHVKHSANYRILDQSFKTYLTSTQYKVFGCISKQRQYFKRFDKVSHKTLKHILGYVIFLINQDEVDVIYICVLPQYRRQGIASKLLNVSRETLRIKKMFLEVSVHNFCAIAFYEALGFTPLSIRQKYMNGHDAYLMSKTFSQTDYSYCKF
ncbi:MAG: GNAT family N-acetyltransferase [Holosporales bacterium]|nr:GNAT family N-acetyltransferase [Holosporales bacterium]